MERMHDKVTIVLLAGGRATRLPGKLALPIGEEPMLLRVYRQLTHSGYPCILSVREELSASALGGLTAPFVLDEYADAGPLGGLASAAKRVFTPLLFAAAADLPNLNDHAVEALMRRYEDERESASTAAEAVVPRHSNGDVEPLAALYDTKALLTSAERALRSDRRKVTEALAGLRVIYYDIPQVEESRYLNVNTAEDFQNMKIS